MTTKVPETETNESNTNSEWFLSRRVGSVLLFSLIKALLKSQLSSFSHDATASLLKCQRMPIFPV